MVGGREGREGGMEGQREGRESREGRRKGREESGEREQRVRLRESNVSKVLSLIMCTLGSAMQVNM